MSGTDHPTRAPEGDAGSPWRQESSYGKNAVHRWGDLAEFHAAAHRPDGIHVIASAHGGPYELLTQGEPFEQQEGPVLAIFSGAVGKREGRRPPFLSGRSLAPGLGLPLIALSDPSLSLAPGLSIAWYAGSEHQRVQSATEDLLRPLAESPGADLWVVGGSAGGFAALEAGHRLGESCSVFVWNPQTEIAEYSPRFVRQYAEAAFPSSRPALRTPQWKTGLGEAMAAAGCRGDLTADLPAGSAPRRIFYLQSADDDPHVQRHAVPYLGSQGYRRLEPGIWTDGTERVAWFAETGKGHTPPAGDRIHAILERLTRPDRDPVLDQVLEMDAQSFFDRSRPWTRPDDLRPVRDEVAGLVSWRVRGHRVSSSLRMLPADYARLHWKAAVLDARDRVLQSAADLSTASSWDFVPDPAMRRMRVELVDGMGHLLVRRHIPLKAS
ncbi:hypothetical protein [Kocuria palustris]|uniref:hypothetical protein n=1 Tax=Kocuria palustris TaxID=71999 RepID=UPI0011AA7911|nr:hypothetical protein [Kocuria palustris]